MVKWTNKMESKLRTPNAELRTNSGIPVKTVYTPQDLQGCDYLKDIGFPGQYPFLRGVYPTMYRGKLWTMRQYAGFASVSESNRRYRYLLEHGETGLSVAFDLPTQLGLDSDNPIAHDEVGKVGVPISSLEDMELLFKDIPLDKVSVSMTINASAVMLLAMYIVIAEKRGIPISNLRGTIQNDILKEYVARGNFIYPIEPSMRLATDIIVYCRHHMPKWNSISISGYHIREAGATAVQELAFTFANAIAYVKSVLEKGLDVDEFCNRLSFFFAVHMDFFEEIAKFRAARRIWAKLMKERFGAKKLESCMLRFHIHTGGVCLTSQQPENNIVRVALQAMAAVLGGTQSLHTCSYDEALALPSEHAVMLALRTQQVIATETGVPNTVDPLGGSYYVESLTNELENRVWKLLDEIESMGGAISAISKGYMQEEIQKSAFAYQKEIEAGERIIVGVNAFIGERQEIPQILHIDPEIKKEQIRRLNELKKKRSNKKVRTSLESLQNAAKGFDLSSAEGKENLMPFIIDCVRNYATLGEICNTLKSVFGAYTL
ncbi:MAG: methylmalonyl-CoA mutase family protein [Candidatus Brocadiales bacterium]|nr:methylmalonyl-CoA mutase family protein [Candidatus Brocadiales bacterium]